ncbi:type IV secretory system conjugative DNA transfer family protein [Cupriavidus sp. CP313]
MKKRIKIVAGGVVGAGVLGGLAVAGQYAGATVFAQLQHLPASAVGIFTLHDYWIAYGSIPEVKRALAASSAVAAVIPVAPIVLGCIALFSKKDRELHGSARWAKAHEIRKMGLLAHKGKEAPIIVGMVGKQYLLYWGQQFVMLAAPTRSGKGVAIVIPNLLTYPGSVVVMDLKLENYGYTSRYRQLCGQKVFLWAPFDESGRTHRWNPFARIAARAENAPHLCVDDVQAIGIKLFPGTDPKQRFWDEQARDLFQGLALYLIATQGRCSFGEVLRLGTGDGDTRAHLKSLIEDKALTGLLAPYCQNALRRVASGSADVLGNVVATFNAGMRLFSNPLVDAATSDCDFKIGNVRRERMSIYIGIPANRLETAPLLVNLFFSQLIEENTTVLPAQDPTLKYQCLLICDEFTSVGRINIIDKANAYIAGYNVRLLTIIQSVAQLEPDALYGKHGTRTLVTNHGLKLVYPPREDEEAAALEKSLGYFTVKAKSTGRSRGKSSSSSENVSDQKRALMMAQELKEMPQDEEIIVGLGKPVLAKKAYFYNDAFFIDKLKAISPTLQALVSPSEDDFKAALFSGELCTKDVPINDPLAWMRRVANLRGAAAKPGAAVVDKSDISQALAEAIRADVSAFVLQATGINIALTNQMVAADDVPAQNDVATAPVATAA